MTMDLFLMVYSVNSMPQGTLRQLRHPTFPARRLWTHFHHIDLPEFCVPWNYCGCMDNPLC